MTNISALEAKTHFGELLGRVQKGEEVVITRYNKPVGRIVPEEYRDPKKIINAVDNLIALQKRIRDRSAEEATLTHAEVRKAIEEGRQ